MTQHEIVEYFTKWQKQHDDEQKALLMSHRLNHKRKLDEYNMKKNDIFREMKDSIDSIEKALHMMNSLTDYNDRRVFYHLFRLRYYNIIDLSVYTYENLNNLELPIGSEKYVYNIENLTYDNFIVSLQFKFFECQSPDQDENYMDIN